MISMLVLTLLLLGLMGSVIQSRRVNEGTLGRMVATQVAQGYMEQLRGMNTRKSSSTTVTISNGDDGTGSALVSSFPIQMYTNQGDTTFIIWTTPSTTTLTLTTGKQSSPPASSGAVDNLDDINQASYGISAAQLTEAKGAATTWASAWPGGSASTNVTTPWGQYSSPTPYTNDLKMNFWLQVKALGNITTPCYGITLIYSWRIQDGGRNTYYSEMSQNIRSDINSNAMSKEPGF
jgi:hypothetical protein